MMRDRLEQAIATLSEDDQVVWLRMHTCRDNDERAYESETYTECSFGHASHDRVLDVAVMLTAAHWIVTVWYFSGHDWENQQITQHRSPFDAATKVIEECREWLKYAQLEQVPA